MGQWFRERGLDEIRQRGAQRGEDNNKGAGTGRLGSQRGEGEGRGGKGCFADDEDT